MKPPPAPTKVPKTPMAAPNRARSSNVSTDTVIDDNDGMSQPCRRVMGPLRCPGGWGKPRDQRASYARIHWSTLPSVVGVTGGLTASREGRRISASAADGDRSTWRVSVRKRTNRATVGRGRLRRVCLGGSAHRPGSSSD